MQKQAINMFNRYNRPITQDTRVTGRLQGGSLVDEGRDAVVVRIRKEAGNGSSLCDPIYAVYLCYYAPRFPLHFYSFLY